MDPLDPLCPMDMSNGRPLDMMYIGKVFQWCSMDPMEPLDPFPMSNVLYTMDQR